MTEENTNTTTQTRTDEDRMEADGGAENFTSVSESRGIHYNFDMEEE
ncbi:MAG: hypothetical protein SXQ77_08830 [Halobacteria archaeon]|nr:hypothetical protein [Halobacteria archaeon]